MYAITKVSPTINRVTADNRTLGWVRKTTIEVPARGAFYPYTVTRTEWIADPFKGSYVGGFPTRKAAAEYLAAHAE